MNIALVVAGGSGTRMGQDVPKQFLCVDNKPIIIYTLERICACRQIDKICVVCVKGWETVVEAYARQFNIDKLAEVTIGGDSRAVSIYNGLTALEGIANDEDIILITDANRPLITDRIIEDSIAKCMEYGAAVSVLPCYDAMYEAREQTLVSRSLDRSVIYRGMGPETLRYKTAVSLLSEYIQKEDYNVSAIMNMMLEKGLPVALSESSSKHIKLTTTEDIEIFKALLKAEKYDWLK